MLLPTLAVALLVVGCTGRETAPASATRPPLLVAIGASDAVGVGASDPARTGWVPQLHQKMPPGTRLVNLGISGARVADAIAHELPIALDIDPDYVVIWIAVNDLVGGTPLPAYERDLNLLLAELSRTRAKLFVANVPNLGALPGAAGRDPRQVAAVIDEWNAVVARAAERNGATVVDLAAGWQELAENPGYISADGFHPSDAGYRRIAELFWAAMEAAGAPGRP
jgi:acyl-CoA thioesterase-1